MKTSCLFIRKWRARADVVVCLVASLLATVSFTWPLCKHLGTLLPRSNNDPLFATWALSTYHRRWDALDFWPIFQGNNFFPHPHSLAFSDTFLGQALLSYPWHLAGAGPVLTHNLALLTVYGLVAVGAYQTGRYLTRSMVGGLTALAVMAFAQPRYTFVDHFNIQSGWLLMPAMACWIRLVAGPSRKAAVGLGLCLGFQWWFTGQVTVFWAVAAAVPLGAATVWRLARAVRTDGLKLHAWLVDWCVALGVALVVAAPIIAVHLSVTDAFKVQRSLSDNFYNSVPPLEYLGSAHASWLQKKLSRGPGFSMYVGLVGVALAVLGALLTLRPGWRKHARARLLDGPLPALTVLLVGVVSAVLSCGPLLRPEGTVRLPYFFLLEHVPGLGSLRAPARFYVPLEVCLAILAALPAAWLARWLWRKHPAASTMALVIPALAAWDLWVPPFPMAGVPSPAPVLEQLSREHPGATLNEIPDGRPENHTATFRSATHSLNTTAGTSGTTPPLTGALYCRANRFPEEETVALMRALGVQYVAVHHGQRPWTADLALDLLPAGVSLWRADGATRIFSLGEGSANLYTVDHLDGHTFPMRLPSRVVSGEPTNSALELSSLVDGVRATIHPASTVTVRLTDAQGTVHTQRTVLRLPAIMEPRFSLATFAFSAPAHPGPLTVEVLHGESVLGQGRTLVADTPLARNAPDLRGIQMTLEANQSTWLTGRCSPVLVHIRNGSPAMLQAYPTPLVMPMDAGRTVLDFDFLRNGRSMKSGRSHQWSILPSVLWHDLAPGDEATVLTYLDAPTMEGPAVLRARLGVISRGHHAQAETELHFYRRAPPPAAP